MALLSGRRSTADRDDPSRTWPQRFFDYLYLNLHLCKGKYDKQALAPGARHGDHALPEAGPRDPQPGGPDETHAVLRANMVRQLLWLHVLGHLPNRPDTLGLQGRLDGRQGRCGRRSLAPRRGSIIRLSSSGRWMATRLRR